MTVDALTSAPTSPVRRLPLSVSLALRELRGGLRGFYVFVLCIALGVAVITTVGALADALRASFERQGETLLGGDVTLSRPHQRASDTDRAWLTAQGRVSEIAGVRAMARRVDGADQSFAEVKGVDVAYPLVGTMKLAGDVTLTPALLANSGAAVDPILLERLSLKVGDRIALGTGTFTIRGVIEAEPDRISERLTVGPRVLVSVAALEASGLADPGSLVQWRYAVKLAPAAISAGGVETFRDRVKAALPEGGYTVRDRRDPSPQVTRTLERLRQFLTLLGLTALLVGGVGVANAVATYIDRRRRIIAAFKSLGATRATIFAIHFAQMMMIATVGVVIGLLAGLLVPFVVAGLVGNALPIRADLALTPGTIVRAALYGYLVALLFTLWPLGRAELIRPAVLFRDEVAPDSVRPRRAILVALGATAAVLLVLAVFGSEARILAFYFCLAIVGILALFWGLGTAVTWAAGRAPRPRQPELRLALSNIAGPGGLARSVVLSLGAGLSLLVAVALVDRSIVSELTGRVPRESPTYFVLDLKRPELAAFETMARAEFKDTKVYTAPMLRGRIVALGNRPAEQVKARPEHQWVLNGDRGLSYAETLPEGSRLVEGAWWAADYQGPPLVSMEAEIAKGLGLKVGDEITVNVLGRNVTAKIANLREVKWESLAINFVLVFTPSTLRGAPHNLLATVTLPATAPLSAEAEIARRIARDHPSSTAVRVKDAIEQANAIFARIMTAVRAAGSVTLLAGALVLAGALATAQRRRIKQAVILKTLGATRRRILAGHMAEYGLLALITSFISVLIGAIAAWVTVSRVMDLPFILSGQAIAEALVLALLLVAVFGSLGTLRALKARPAELLRSE
jgi:putative ABC transport system permease protein